MKLECERAITKSKAPMTKRLIICHWLLVLSLVFGIWSLEFRLVYAEDSTVSVPAASSQRVTLQFQGVDIVEILKLLAEQAGFNLVAGRNVSGRVTLFLKDVDPWEALEVILKANELAYERRGQILTIMTQRDYELLYGQPYRDPRILKSIVPRYAKAADVSRALAQVKSNIGRVIADDSTNTIILMDTPSLVEQMSTLVEQMDQTLQTKVFSLNYGTVKTVTPLLQETITKGMGKLSVDERTNKIVVTDYPEKLETIATMVKAFDERSTEVLIEATIMQIALSDQYQLGVDWETLARKHIDVKGLGALNLTSGGILKVASTAVTQTGDYKILIEALRTFGDAKILSEPRLTVVNNQEARILVGSKEPYVTTSVSQTGTGTAITSESVTFIDVGIKLFVTPTITRDGFVQMRVRPEVSTKTGVLTTSQKNEIPLIETAEAETVLLVEDNATVILGGLIKDEKTVNQQRIPFLGDMPLLGTLFRSNKETKKKTELIVLLTPHIISGFQGELSATVHPPAEKLDSIGYYGAIFDLIQAVARAQTPLAKAKGIVVVEFTLTPGGQLQGEPMIVQSESKVLDPLAWRAVVAVSPFPPFPDDFEKKPRTFKVPITYE